MLESGDNICSIPSVSGEDRILQAMIAAFFLLTPLIILILRKLFMREMFEFWLYVFSLVICLGCGWWLFGDGLYFAISKVYESRFNGSHRQKKIPAYLRLKSTLFRIPKFNIHVMQLGDSLDNR